MISKFNYTGTLALVLSLVFQSTVQAGGSVVGNGAGLVENQFEFAYSNLNLTIDKCISNKNCEFSYNEQILVKKIVRILVKNKNWKNKLTFTSNKDYPDFFQTGPNEPHRIAKTELHSNSTIYLNTDLFYTTDGQPALDFPTISSILVHELGHQTGEKDHQILDILGAKIKKVTAQKMNTYSIDYGTPTSKIEINFITDLEPIKKTDLFISWGNNNSELKTSEILGYLKCLDKENSIAGFNFYNGYYDLNHQPANTTDQIGFGIWVNLYCFSPEAKEIHVEKWRMVLNVKNDLTLSLISLNTILKISQ